MKLFLLAASAILGVTVTQSIVSAADDARGWNRSAYSSPGSTYRTRGNHHAARNKRHIVRYQLDGHRARRFDGRSLAYRWANYVRSLGADVAIQRIDGRYSVTYAMQGRRLRRFQNALLARSFERRLESIGFRVRVERMR